MSEGHIFCAAVVPWTQCFSASRSSILDLKTATGEASEITRFVLLEIRKIGD